VIWIVFYNQIDMIRLKLRVKIIYEYRYETTIKLHNLLITIFSDHHLLKCNQKH